MTVCLGTILLSQKPHGGSQKMREYIVASGFADLGFQLSWIFSWRDVFFVMWCARTSEEWSDGIFCLAH